MSSTYSIDASRGIRNWPADERPREKLIERGAASLSDAELLATFIRSSTAGRTAVDIARELLTRFGSLRELLSADFREVTAISGLGPAKFAQLKAVLELGQRYLGESMRPGQPLSDPETVRCYLGGSPTGPSLRGLLLPLPGQPPPGTGL